MLKRNYRDLIGAALMFSIGLFTLIYSTMKLTIGTFSNMGAGLFPFALGVLLCLMSLGVLVQAALETGSLPHIDVKVMTIVIVGLTVFALLLDRVGLVPATASLIIISGLAHDEVRPLQLATLSLAVSIFAYVIFVMGLGLPLTFARWPF